MQRNDPRLTHATALDHIDYGIPMAHNRCSGKTIAMPHAMEDYHTSHCPNASIFKYTQLRQFKNISTSLPPKLIGDYLSKQFPALVNETEYPVGKINKIFASEWVSDRQIVIGTKCNKVIVLDLVTCQMAQIPSLRSSSTSQQAECPCGIHSIDVNPSRTLLATGGENVNDLAVYRLPTFDPVAVGQHGHSDWIFDMKWLDDQFVVTGSRDNKLALWRIEDSPENEPGTSSLSQHTSQSVHPTPNSTHIPLYPHRFESPVSVKLCRRAERVRAMAYSNKRMELAVLSLNAYIHLWDCTTFTQTASRKLLYPRENICMAVNKDKNLYAVGCQSRCVVYDPRAIKSPTHITPTHGQSGTRSVNFNENILTLGTGDGFVHFFDMRAGKFLELACEHECKLQIGRGWLRHDEMYEEYFFDQDYPSAVYTHSFDTTGTMMFCGGGPLPAGLWGNYAGLWH